VGDDDVYLLVSHRQSLNHEEAAKSNQLIMEENIAAADDKVDIHKGWERTSNHLREIFEKADKTVNHFHHNEPSTKEQQSLLNEKPSTGKKEIGFVKTKLKGIKLN
jgi:hypothetical protein